MKRFHVVWICEGYTDAGYGNIILGKPASTDKHGGDIQPIVSYIYIFQNW